MATTIHLHRYSGGGREGNEREGGFLTARKCFASVVKALDRYQAQKANGAFRSWLWRITSNKIRDYLRRTRREVDGVGGSSALRSLQQVPAEAMLPDAEPTQPEQLSELFARALAQVQAEFTSRTWDIFQRAVVDQIEVAVVAEEFSVTPAAIRQARSRVLRRIRQQLGDIDP